MESLDNDYNSSGVLILSNNEESLIKSSMKNLKCTAKVKFCHMLAYQIELGYNLALAPEDVIVSNLGFESVLCVLCSNK